VSLRGKLLLAQAPLALALVLFAIAAVRTLSALGAHSEDILKDNFRSVLAAQRMKDALERVDSAVLFILAGHRDLARAQLDDNRRSFETELLVEEHNITEAGEAEVARHLRGHWQEYAEAINRYVLLAGPEELTRAYFGELNPRFTRVKDDADHVLAINQDAMVRRSDAVQRRAQTFTGFLVAGALAALLLGAASSVSLTARLLGPLRGLSNAVRRLGEGDLEARALVPGHDEIAELAREFNTMATRLAQYRRSSLGELLEAQQSAQAAIDGLPDPVVIFGLLGQVLSANRAAGELLGITLEMNAPDPLARTPPAVREVLERVRAHVMGGRGPWIPSGFEAVVRVASPQGERKFLPRGTPVDSDERGVAGAAIVLQDVTRLMFFDELRNDLVATVAHEFRTPLTSLRMAVHLLLEEAAGPLTEKQADLLQAAREETEKLQGIVDDVLDVSRIQSGRLALERTVVAADELLRPLEGERGLAEQRGVRLTLADETASNDRLEVDRDRVGIVLTNLVDNALRHSPRGGEVRVRALARGERIRFEVTDTGAGIPPEFRERIFEKHFQLPGRPAGGAGLGLYIARELVLAHGGEVGVTDAPGGGSLFFVELPRAAGEEA
jgi:NtrC-family two-component system sensor histidine kinase KinB